MVILPLYWTIGKKKIPLSLNTYRNAHYRVLAQIKREYTESLELSGDLQTPVQITFHFYPKTKAQDLDNFCSVACKMFLDALIHYEIIPKDTPEYVQEIRFISHHKDNENPRIEVEILENSLQ